MATDYANGYASIVKYDKNDDGTLMVYGNATDDTLDLDSQICDPTWLDSAMPAWFKSGGNVREMHGPSAAGVAKEYEVKAGQHWIGVHVVDPIAVKKVENRVYQGFSIGIKSPRVVRDSKAANGRIIDGQIIEVSLVDRPANPSAKLILAKSVDGEPTLIQVEEAHEYNAPLPSEIFKHGDHDQSDHSPTGGGGSSEKPSDSDKPSEDSGKPDGNRTPSEETRTNINDHARDLQGAALENSNIDPDDPGMDFAEGQIDSAMDHLESAEMAETAKEAVDQLDMAERNLSNAIDRLESQRYLEEASSLYQISQQISATARAIESGKFKSATPTTTRKELKMNTIKQILELTESLAEMSKSLDMPMNGESKAIPSRDEMVERYMAARKALDDVASEAKSHGYDDIDKEYGETAEEETAEGPAVAAETAEEEVEEAREGKPTDETKAAEESEDDEEKSEDDKEKKKKVSEDDESEDDEAIKSLVEKAVKSAMEMVKGEIDTLRAEKESAVEKSVKLETELTTALSKSVAGGPKRTAIAQGAVSNEYLAKGLAYKAKADATTDPVLAKGYREIANELLAKADSKTTTK
jgi:hypothetical protein